MVFNFWLLAYNGTSSWFFQLNRLVWYSTVQITLLNAQIHRHLNAHIFASTLCCQIYYEFYNFLPCLWFHVFVWVLIYWCIKCECVCTHLLLFPTGRNPFQICVHTTVYIDINENLHVIFYICSCSCKFGWASLMESVLVSLDEYPL